MSCERACGEFNLIRGRWDVTSEGREGIHYIREREGKSRGGCSENDILPVPSSADHKNEFTSGAAAKIRPYVQPAFMRERAVFMNESRTTDVGTGVAAMVVIPQASAVELTAVAQTRCPWSPEM